MFIVMAAKIMIFAFSMLPIAFGALATGIIFGCFLLGSSKNPLETDNLFASAIVGFVIVESFVFTALVVCVVI